MADEIEFLDSIQRELDKQLLESPKNYLIGRSTELISML